MKLRHLLFLVLPFLAATLRAQFVPMAVDRATYAPNYTTNQGAPLAIDRTSGALLVYDLAGGGSGPVAADPGFSAFRSTALGATATAIKASGGNLYGVRIINVNTVPVYVKFYNVAAGSVTVGTTAVTHVEMVPPGDGTTPGLLLLSPGSTSLKYFSTAIAAAVVTGLADNSTAAPSTAVYAEIEYK